MRRLSLLHFSIAGLLFWGLPAVFVVGPQAIIYTVAAVLPVWLLTLRKSDVPARPAQKLSTATCAVLTGFSLIYLIGDSLFGRQMLQYNMFLFRTAGVDRLIEGANTGMSKGGGVADLLGSILLLLPFGLIDSTRLASKYARSALWSIAIIILFYQAGSGRAAVLMAVMAIAFGKSSDWRRILVAVGLALAAFAVASSFRGDTANTDVPLLNGIAWPFINLGLMLDAHCGTAPWYSFIAEFLKKFLPAFLFPKTIFSFNMEMSLCVYPSADNAVTSVSVYTWLGEIFYYKPSLLTAVLAGCLLAILAWVVDRRFVANQMYSARLFAGLLCFNYPRSRTQDMFTFLIGQFIFLVFVFPFLTNLTRMLRRFLMPANPAGVQPEPGREAS